MLLSEPRQPDHEKRGQPEMVQVIGDLDGNLRSVCRGMTHIGRVADDTPSGRQRHEAMVLRVITGCSAASLAAEVRCDR